MIESLGDHGVQAMDLVPALMTTHTVANPEYDPEEAKKQAEEDKVKESERPAQPSKPVDEQSISDETLVNEPLSDLEHPKSQDMELPQKPYQTTAKVLAETSTAAMPGVTTSLSVADKDVTLDIRWTVLCDLFLVLIADSVYDARSRVLLENVANKLGLGWLDVVKFESRVTEALEIQEDVENLEHRDLLEEHQKLAKKKRYMILGLATLGGGLVIGLSAGLLAPVIGAGLGAAFTTIGITGTTGFLAGAGGAAVITTGGVLTGSGIAAKGMANRTQQVRTFDILPLHNNKRVSCILTVPGFMNGAQDDVRLPFSVLDPVVGDVFSVLWEPEMIRETGSALKILTSEVLSQVGMTVLQATVMTALMSALQWPVILTKLGYLIDNPWNNALDRARRAGLVLADVLIHRHLGVRPVTLIGFSLGSRVIFYALLELAKQKAFGVVQDVFLLGATLTASTRSWCEARSVVSGRFVNCYARNDWVLNYLFRATSGGVGTVAGLRPVNDIPGLENVDVTDKIAGHMSYRTFMPLILDQLGFPVFSDYFDEPEEPDFEGDRIVVREDVEQKKGWFSRNKSRTQLQHISRPPSASNFTRRVSADNASVKGRASVDDDLPPRVEHPPATGGETVTPAGKTQAAPVSGAATPVRGSMDSNSQIPMHAGFDFAAIKQALGDPQTDVDGVVKEVNGVNASQSKPISHSSSVPAQHKGKNGGLQFEDGLKVADVTPTSRKIVDLTSSLPRAVSLTERDGLTIHEEDYEAELAGPSQFGMARSISQSQFRSASYESFMNAPRSSEPTMSFADSSGSIWDSNSPNMSASSSTIPRFASTLATASTTTLTQAPFQDQDRFGKPIPSPSSLSVSNQGIATLPSTLSANPFASPTYAMSATPGLSFGGADGSITVGSSGDPWSFGNSSALGSNIDLGRKRTQVSQGFDANPWS
ncbi:hypothetical protein AX17_003211 [Amanita inopinata Kibby_2008]|nr:hypothetical protein AX17_003211 [Amanita inopinata Kibby_2008]